jgi:hypothetical protein
MTRSVPIEVLAAMTTEELLYLQSKACPNDAPPSDVTPCPYTGPAAAITCGSAEVMAAN